MGTTCLKGNELQPAYLRVYESGELHRRVERALAALADCTLCPRDCHIDRLANKFAVCKSGRYAVVGSHFPHFGEENCLRGWNGSGTIFFSWCNLRCVFCQNYDISWKGSGQGTRPEDLAAMMLRLQEQGCHNINFVTPEHVVAQILEALPLAIEGGLRLPLVYNTSAYDSLHSIELMDGLVDIYMPDFKFWDPEMARHYSKARNYPEAARQVIKAMHQQVGDLGSVNTNGHNHVTMRRWNSRTLNTNGSRHTCRCSAATSAFRTSRCSTPSCMSPSMAANGAGYPHGLATGTPSTPA